MQLAVARGYLERIDVPVLTFEMRVRHRAFKPFALMLVYVLVLSAIAMAAIGFSHGSVASQSALRNPEERAMMVRAIFVGLCLVQLFMLAVACPVLSAFSVSRERERGTFELLALTTLSSGAIITQKQAAAVAQGLMLVLVSAPIVGVVFLLGGVAPSEVAISYALLASTVLMLGSFGVFCSCFMPNSPAAVTLTYVAEILFFPPVFFRSFVYFMGMGAPGYAGHSLFSFAFMFAVSGGILATIVYTCVSLALRIGHARPTRAVRIAVFGGVYALLLANLSRSILASPSGYGIGMGWLGLVNPFVALQRLMYSGFATRYGPRAAGLFWLWPIIFCGVSSYVLLYLSTLKFSRLRRG